MRTTHLVPVRQDIVDDPYFDLKTLIEKHALMQARAGVNGTRESAWTVLDWSGPLNVNQDTGVPMSYYRVVVEETPKPGSKASQVVEQPIGRIYLPMPRRVVDSIAPNFDLARHINESAILVARATWEEHNPKAKDYRVVDWSGPFDYMYEPGDLPLSAYCFQAYVEVIR